MRVRKLFFEIVDFIKKKKDRLQVDQYTCRRFLFI